HPSVSCPSSFLLTPPPPTATHPLSLHDALPIWISPSRRRRYSCAIGSLTLSTSSLDSHTSSTDPMRAPTRVYPSSGIALPRPAPDRKSTRLNSSHEWISYAVFCLKKKNKKRTLC